MTIEWKCVASLKYNRRQTCLEANPNFHKCYSPHHDGEDAADVEIKFWRRTRAYIALELALANPHFTRCCCLPQYTWLFTTTLPATTFFSLLSFSVQFGFSYFCKICVKFYKDFVHFHFLLHPSYTGLIWARLISRFWKEAKLKSGAAAASTRPPACIR